MGGSNCPPFFMVTRRGTKVSAHHHDDAPQKTEEEIRNAKLLASFSANQSLDPLDIQPVVTMIDDESGVVGEAG